MDPAFYEHEPIPQLRPVTPARYIAELRAVDEACRMDLLLLGICRGQQFLNVYFGGTRRRTIEVGMSEVTANLDLSRFSGHLNACECGGEFSMRSEESTVRCNSRQQRVGNSAAPRETRVPHESTEIEIIDPGAI